MRDGGACSLRSRSSLLRPKSWTAAAAAVSISMAASSLLPRAAAYVAPSFLPSARTMGFQAAGSQGRTALFGGLSLRSPLNRVQLSSLSMVAAKDADATPKKGKKVKEESIYSGTVNLPQTGFNQRANSPVREPELQNFWKEKRIYERLHEESKGEKFVLHDGPPYANGDLHIGHALNKILKDFINRYKILQGKKVRFVPGWDCHGLPIELKVLQNLKSDEKKALTPFKLRKKAAAFARKTVETQKESFKRYGVWADWDEPYLTLEPAYEAAQIEAFAAMVKGGHIYRGRKPVNWSPSSRTALAEAELEYPEGHKSKSMYAAFEITSPSEALKEHADNLKVAIWTTTPWTIPANLAVAVNEKLDYVVVKHGGIKLIVAKDLTAALAKKLAGEEEEEAKLEVLCEMKGKDLSGTKYKHPLFDRESEIVIGGDYITTESGTGLVHTAPGHGVEDYQTGLKYGLELLSPVDDAGRFTDEAGPDLVGKDVLYVAPYKMMRVVVPYKAKQKASDGNDAVIEMMKAAGSLLKVEPYGHKYPYDWRTKKPTIFRATDQWFASVENFRAECLAAIDTVTWIPEVGKKRITPMVEGRSDWCISRQRSWGVPIPVFYNIETGDPLLTDESIEHVRKVIAEHGSDAWWSMETEELLPPSHKAEAEKWERGKDTMDVWFDSGSSWNGVAKSWGGGEALGYPADMYLEGSDQHRGWFQSSLLTSVAAQGKAPYKTVLTHGFVLDEKGFKMSKSLGNVVDPRLVIEGGKNQKLEPAFGADVLRLWVSSVDYSGDVRVGANIMKQVSDAYRKIRNTLRYLIGNMYDFNPETDSVKYEDLPSIDKWMLGQLSKVQAEVKESFETFQFYRASQAIQAFVITDLSNFYLDVAKDRLYISDPTDPRRRSCQTVLKEVMDMLLSAIAPLLPHMAEDVWLNIPWKTEHDSVFQAGWRGLDYAAHEEAMWGQLRAVRDDVNVCMEAARNSKLIGASLEAAVYIHCADPELAKVLTEFKSSGSHLQHPTSEGFNAVDDIRFILLASQVHLVSSPEEVSAACEEAHTQSLSRATSGCFVGVAKAAGDKCERCWFYDDSVGTHSGCEKVCPRCGAAVAAQKA